MSKNKYLLLIALVFLCTCVGAPEKEYKDNPSDDVTPGFPGDNYIPMDAYVVENLSDLQIALNSPATPNIYVTQDIVLNNGDSLTVDSLHTVTFLLVAPSVPHAAKPGDRGSLQLNTGSKLTITGNGRLVFLKGSFFEITSLAGVQISAQSGAASFSFETSKELKDGYTLSALGSVPGIKVLVSGIEFSLTPSSSLNELLQNSVIAYLREAFSGITGAGLVPVTQINAWGQYDAQYGTTGYTENGASFNLPPNNPGLYSIYYEVDTPLEGVSFDNIRTITFKKDTAGTYVIKFVIKYLENGAAIQGKISFDARARTRDVSFIDYPHINTNEITAYNDMVLDTESPYYGTKFVDVKINTNSSTNRFPPNPGGDITFRITKTNEQSISIEQIDPDENPLFISYKYPYAITNAIATGGPTGDTVHDFTINLGPVNGNGLPEKGIYDAGGTVWLSVNVSEYGKTSVNYLFHILVSASGTSTSISSYDYSVDKDTKKISDGNKMITQYTYVANILNGIEKSHSSQQLKIVPQDVTTETPDAFKNAAGKELTETITKDDKLFALSADKTVAKLYSIAMEPSKLLITSVNLANSTLPDDTYQIEANIPAGGTSFSVQFAPSDRLLYNESAAVDVINLSPGNAEVKTIGINRVRVTENRISTEYKILPGYTISPGANVIMINVPVNNSSLVRVLEFDLGIAGSAQTRKIAGDLSSGKKFKLTQPGRSQGIDLKNLLYDGGNPTTYTIAAGSAGVSEKTVTDATDCVIFSGGSILSYKNSTGLSKNLDLFNTNQSDLALNTLLTKLGSGGKFTISADGKISAVKPAASVLNASWLTKTFYDTVKPILKTDSLFITDDGTEEGGNEPALVLGTNSFSIPEGVILSLRGKTDVAGKGAITSSGNITFTIEGTLIDASTGGGNNNDWQIFSGLAAGSRVGFKSGSSYGFSNYTNLNSGEGLDSAAAGPRAVIGVLPSAIADVSGSLGSAYRHGIVVSGAAGSFSWTRGENDTDWALCADSGVVTFSAPKHGGSSKVWTVAAGATLEIPGTSLFTLTGGGGSLVVNGILKSGGVTITQSTLNAGTAYGTSDINFNGTALTDADTGVSINFQGGSKINSSSGGTVLLETAGALQLADNAVFETFLGTFTAKNGGKLIDTTLTATNLYDGIASGIEAGGTFNFEYGAHWSKGTVPVVLDIDLASRNVTDGQFHYMKAGSTITLSKNTAGPAGAKTITINGGVVLRPDTVNVKYIVKNGAELEVAEIGTLKPKGDNITTAGESGLLFNGTNSGLQVESGGRFKGLVTFDNALVTNLSSAIKLEAGSYWQDTQIGTLYDRTEAAQVGPGFASTNSIAIVTGSAIAWMLYPASMNKASATMQNYIVFGKTIGLNTTTAGITFTSSTEKGAVISVKTHAPTLDAGKKILYTSNSIAYKIKNDVSTNNQVLNTNTGWKSVTNTAVPVPASFETPVLYTDSRKTFSVKEFVYQSGEYHTSADAETNGYIDDGTASRIITNTSLPPVQGSPLYTYNINYAGLFILEN